MVSVQNLQEIKISQVLAFHFSTRFRGYLETYLEPGRTSFVQWRFFAEILNFLGPLKIVL